MGREPTTLFLFAAIAGLVVVFFLLVAEKRAKHKLYRDMVLLNTEIQMAYDGIIEGWAAALDMRDFESAGHSRRVSFAAFELAKQMGVQGQELLDIKRGALLHDIGKISIPDHILLKPGPLDEFEWRIMRKHPEDAAYFLSSAPYLGKAVDIPLCHHEKWDGSGYPRGLKGEAIPLSARIFSVIDVWDALLANRPYRKAWSEAAALEYIKGKAGTDFDPKVVSGFVECLPQIQNICGSHEQALPDLLIPPKPFPAAGNTDKQTLLIVDDCRSDQKLLAGILKPEGYHVILASTGVEALAIVQSEDIDLVLLDILMPEMDGYHVCRHLKQNTLTRNIPVIFLTALTEQESEIAGLNLGAIDYVTKPIVASILKARVRNHVDMKKYRDSLEMISLFDYLTTIPNRRYFEFQLEKEWRRSLRTQDYISVFFIDIDSFKQYNDQFGHAAGDDCLKLVAAAINRKARRTGDFVARIGGEEFALIAPASGYQGAGVLGDIICKTVRENSPVTVSIGIATASVTQESSPQGLMRQADEALYQAKALGKNRIVQVGP